MNALTLAFLACCCAPLALWAAPGEESTADKPAETAPPAAVQETPPTVVEFPQAGFKVEFPKPWTKMPPFLEEQVRGLARQKFANTPLARVTFDTGLLRGQDFTGMINGEYLVVTKSPERPSANDLATAYPQARRAMEAAGATAWEDSVSDFGLERMIFSIERGMLIWPGRAKHFDGSKIRLRFYAIPTRHYTMVLFAGGGSKEPDKVFAEVEAALAKFPIAEAERVPESFWTELELALAKANVKDGHVIEKSAAQKAKDAAKRSVAPLP